MLVLILLLVASIAHERKVAHKSKIVNQGTSMKLDYDGEVHAHVVHLEGFNHLVSVSCSAGGVKLRFNSTHNTPSIPRHSLLNGGARFFCEPNKPLLMQVNGPHTQLDPYTFFLSTHAAKATNMFQKLRLRAEYSIDSIPQPEPQNHRPQHRGLLETTFGPYILPNNVPLYNSGSVTLWANASLGIQQIIVRLAWDVSWSLTNGGFLQETTTAEFIVGGNATIGVESLAEWHATDRLQLFKQNLQTILFFIGDIPVYIAPSITFDVAGRLTLGGSISAGFTNELSKSFTVGAIYSSTSGWDWIFRQMPMQIQILKPYFRVSVTAEVEADFIIGLHLPVNEIPFLFEFIPTLGASFDASLSVANGELYYYVSVTIGIESLSILGIATKAYQKSVNVVAHTTLLSFSKTLLVEDQTPSPQCQCMPWDVRCYFTNEGCSATQPADPCPRLTNCSSCVSNPLCGWCGGNATCSMALGGTGPVPPYTCPRDWSVGSDSCRPPTPPVVITSVTTSTGVNADTVVFQPNSVLIISWSGGGSSGCLISFTVESGNRSSVASGAGEPTTPVQSPYQLTYLGGLESSTNTTNTTIAIVVTSALNERNNDRHVVVLKPGAGIGTWNIGGWGPCSPSCGTGRLQNRTVSCLDSQSRPASCSTSRPTSTQLCASVPCTKSTLVLIAPQSSAAFTLGSAVELQWSGGLQLGTMQITQRNDSDVIVFDQTVQNTGAYTVNLTSGGSFYFTLTDTSDPTNTVVSGTFYVQAMVNYTLTGTLSKGAYVILQGTLGLWNFTLPKSLPFSLFHLDMGRLQTINVPVQNKSQEVVKLQATYPTGVITEYGFTVDYSIEYESTAKACPNVVVEGDCRGVWCVWCPTSQKCMPGYSNNALWPFTCPSPYQYAPITGKYTLSGSFNLLTMVCIWGSEGRDIMPWPQGYNPYNFPSAFIGIPYRIALAIGSGTGTVTLVSEYPSGTTPIVYGAYYVNSSATADFCPNPANYQTCALTFSQRCGWCGATGLCIPGNSSKPFSPFNCSFGWNVAPTPAPTKSPTTRTPTTRSPTTQSPTTLNPTTTSPTVSPTTSPTTLNPTTSPTVSPTTSPTHGPTAGITLSPTTRTSNPTSVTPTSATPITLSPTTMRTSNPTSATITLSPTTLRTSNPTATSTLSPTTPRTSNPTATSTLSPTTLRTPNPTSATATTLSPTTTPLGPTTNPTTSPPTQVPTPISATLIPTPISTLSPTTVSLMPTTISPMTTSPTPISPSKSSHPTLHPTVSLSPISSLSPSRPPSSTSLKSSGPAITLSALSFLLSFLASVVLVC